MLIPVFAFFLIKALKYRLKGLGVSQLCEKYPSIWKYFGVQETQPAAPLPIPEHLLRRAVFRTLPDDLNEPTPPDIKLGSDFTYKCVSRFGTATGQQGTAFMLEVGALCKIMFGSILFMSERLGLTNTVDYKNILAKFEVDKSTIYFGDPQKRPKTLQVEAEQGSLKLWAYHNLSFAYTDIRSLVGDQLEKICDAMGIDYDSAGWSYEPGSSRSKYVGWGSLGMIGLAMGMTFASALKSKIGNALDKSMFKDANVFIAYNEIVDYFNMNY